ncbi:MAG: hypothetical protein KKE20_01645 [Nanoarchaeota archaeon]|nr:hypothetical protein [Nanoarchaeota archaeon]
MEPENKRPRDAVESFVQNMVESSKHAFEPGKPNNAGDEDPKEIEDIAKRIKDRLQRS